VVTDSVACLNRELVEQYNIDIIPIIISAGGKTYRDWVDITPSEAYKIFLENPDSFNTSSASPADCLEVFRKASQRAASILCVTLSTKLSTLHNAALDARELAKTELPETNIEVIDSNSATPSEGMVALAAARTAAEGKDLAEVIKVAEDVRGKVSAIVFLDTLRHVYRSGRIPKIASQIGSVLNIKPILTVAETVNFAGMAGSRKAGIERMLRMMRNKLGNMPAHVAVTHAYALEEAEKLKERIAAEFNCVELWLSEFSPVMGYACGTGTVGIAFYPEDSKEK
jgi:DegV family protein with EDD domain